MMALSPSGLFCEHLVWSWLFLIGFFCDYDDEENELCDSWFAAFDIKPPPDEPYSFKLREQVSQTVRRKLERIMYELTMFLEMLIWKIIGSIFK